MLRLLDIFWVKNSRPFFSKLVWVRASNINTLLMGIIKPYHYYYRYFLLKPLDSEIFAGPFHQAKAVSSSFTVYQCSRIVSIGFCVAPALCLIFSALPCNKSRKKEASCFLATNITFLGNGLSNKVWPSKCAQNSKQREIGRTSSIRFWAQIAGCPWSES